MTQWVNSISEKKCDGIFHCFYGEDEQFEHCKDTFPKEATIQCIENRLPGTIDVTIFAIPCDGIVECRDGSDENCEEDKIVLVIAISALFLATICIYFYLVFVRLPFRNRSILQDFKNEGIDFKTQVHDRSELKGNSLAKIKVFIAKWYVTEIEVCENSFTKLTEDPKLGLTP